MKLVQYKKGSIVYFEGDIRENSTYLLKNGELIRKKTSISSAIEKSRIGVGEFFGLKSSLGPIARDETIEALSDCTIYVLSPDEFLSIVKKNMKVLIRSLTAFSNELRKIHKAIEHKLNVKEADLDDKLLGIADYYREKKAYRQSLYAYNRYLELYPHQPKVGLAKEKIQAIRSMLETT